ncbi:hypothetical protein BASA61_009673 [Batrachochytrium salamandrivorans]|nr:hypothetical protein BASA62_007498 [Batrachochytrium salamandrivorans]KAH6580441.1 hypothetical protein BASA61_009673 [Batrachochytrium salamandrivorans]
MQPLTETDLHPPQPNILQPGIRESSSAQIVYPIKQEPASSKQTTLSSSSNQQLPSKRPKLASPNTMLNPQTSDGQPTQYNRGASMNNNRSSSSASKTQAKKLIIKSFRVKPRLPDNYEADTWERLRLAVDAIHKRIPIQDSLEELYKACENLCHHRKQDSLYQRLHSVCKEHVLNELVVLKKTMINESVSSLVALNDCWSSYCQQMISIRSIFLYLDRTFVLQTPALKSIWNMSMDLFRDYILENPDVQQRVVQGLIQQTNRERHSEQISRPLLRSLVRMMIDLNIYIRIFETPFLENTRMFYRTYSKNIVDCLDGAASSAVGGSISCANSVSAYLIQVTDRLEQEASRCAPGEGYLDPVTRKKLVLTLEDELIRNHATTLLDAGFNGLVAEQRLDDLGRIYKLFERIGMLDELKRRFSNYIKEAGILIVKDVSRDKTMVADLLEFKMRLDEILRVAFHSTESFDHTMKESFEKFINQRQNKPAEMIAKYIDELLKHVKGMTDTDVDKRLDQCLAIFRLVQGKDVFEAFYSKDLAKRLLLDKSASVDAEKSMLFKLKAECGPGFTSKLEGMFKDMELSRDIKRKFEDSAGFHDRIGPIDLNVYVLTSGLWPSYQPIELELPEELSNCQEVFKEYYMSKHSGRRLVWHNSLGSCLLRAQFSKPKELHVSLFQAVVMMCFNDAAILSFSEIQARTNLEEKELVRTLQSLAVGKTRVLVKSSKGKDVDTVDNFEVNEQFIHPQYRIKIGSISVRESVDEMVETNEKVFQDRVFQVDAAIVRIMKTEKRCAHGILVSKLFQLVKFPIAAEDLKKRIESLIEREYVDRDSTDRNCYVYLA